MAYQLNFFLYIWAEMALESFFLVAGKISTFGVRFTAGSRVERLKMWMFRIFIVSTVVLHQFYDKLWWILAKVVKIKSEQCRYAFLVLKMGPWQAYFFPLNFSWNNQCNIMKLFFLTCFSLISFILWLCFFV